MADILMCEDTDIQRHDGHVKMEAEVGFMLPPAKECLGLPGVGRGEERSFLLHTPHHPHSRTFRKSMALPTSRFKMSSLQNCENVYCLKSLSLWLQKPQGNNTECKQVLHCLRLSNTFQEAWCLVTLHVTVTTKNIHAHVSESSTILLLVEQYWQVII